MLFVDNTVMLVQSRDGIRVQKAFKIGDFYEQMEEVRYSEECCAVMRLPGGTIDSMSAVPLTWIDFSAKVLKSELPGIGIVQRYIKSHSDRPTVSRVFYINTSKTSKATHCVVMANTELAKKKYLLGGKILQPEKHDGIEIYV
jgi:hypothetical protein